MVHIPSPDDLDRGHCPNNIVPVQTKRQELIELLTKNPHGTDVDAKFFEIDGFDTGVILRKELSDAGWQVYPQLGQNVIWRHFGIGRKNEKRDSVCVGWR